MTLPLVTDLPARQNGPTSGSHLDPVLPIWKISTIEKEKETRGKRENIRIPVSSLSFCVNK